MRQLLWRAIRDAPVATATYVLLSVVCAALVIAEPALLANTIDAVLTGSPLGGPLGLLCAVLIAGLIGRSTAAWAGARAQIEATRGLRSGLLTHALRLPTPHTQPFPAGDLISRVSTDAGQPSALLSIAVQLGLGAVVGVAGLVALALLDWPTTLVLVGGAGLSYLIVRSFVADFSGPVQRYREAGAELATRLLDACRGARTIRAAGTLTREQERVLRPLAGMREAAAGQWKTQRRLVFRISSMHHLLTVSVLAVAGYRVAGGALTPGDLLAVLGYTTLVTGTLDQLDAASEIIYVRAGARRVHEVFAQSEALPEPPAPMLLPAGPLSVRLDSVSLTIGGTAILDRVRLDIPAGAHVAVVGRSGSGKSALCSLTGRLIDPSSGAVLLTGIDIRTVARQDLRQRIAYAFEKPELFGATIAEALAAGRPGATREHVTAAATAARADRFINCLPDGYDTELSGLVLSGGEVQRLGLARALVGDASLIVLDDATSNLDTATEAEIFAAVRRAWAGRTALVVAHRLVTAAEADLVAWLEDGRLRGYGPHQTLWQDTDYRAHFGQAALAPVAA